MLTVLFDFSFRRRITATGLAGAPNRSPWLLLLDNTLLFLDNTLLLLESISLLLFPFQLSNSFFMPIGAQMIFPISPVPRRSANLAAGKGALFFSFLLVNRGSLDFFCLIESSPCCKTIWSCLSISY